MPAIQHVKRVLFDPFNLRKWLVLALVALLAGVMKGGGGPSFNVPGNIGGAPGRSPAEVGEDVVEWVQGHLAETIVGGIVLGVLLIGFSLLMLYISSVFRFIFLECVVTNEVRIGASWRKNQPQGLAYMWWRIGFGLLSFLAFVILVGVPVLGFILVVMQGLQGWGAGAPIVGGIACVMIAVAMSLLWVIITGLIAAMTRDFVLPIMYLRRVGTLEGWRTFWPLLCDNKMGFVIYFLMKIVCAMAAGVAGVLGGLAALIVAVIPLGLLAGIGYGLVFLLNITAWSWWYLVPLVPLGVIVILALAYWMTCVLLPIPIYFQAYALKYLGFVDPELQTI